MIVDTLRIHSNNLNKKHYLLHEVIEFVGRIERLLVGQYQRLDHMQCPLLVLLKMFRSDMLLVSLAACIGFENRYLAGVLLFADRIHRQHTRFGAQGDFAHFSCVFHILVKILRVNLYFRQPHDAISAHRLFSAHTRLLIQIQTFANDLSCRKIGVGRELEQDGFQFRIVEFAVAVEHVGSGVCIDYRANEVVETLGFINIHHLALHRERDASMTGVPYSPVW